MGIILKQGIRNTIITYIGIMVGFVNIIVIQPLFLSTAEIGLIRLLFSFSSLLSIFIPLGIANATVRFFPYFRDEGSGHNGFFRLLLVFPVTGFAITSLLITLFRSWIESKYQADSAMFNDYFNWVYLMAFCMSFSTVLSIYSQSLFKTTFPLLVNEIYLRVISIVLFALYFNRVISLDALVGTYVGIFVTQMLLLLVYVGISGNISLSINREIYTPTRRKEIIGYGLLLAFANISAMGIKYIDSLMLGSFLSLSAVGVYSIMAFIPTVIEAPLSATDKIAGPKVAQAWKDGDMKLISDVYHKSSRYMLLLGGWLFMGVVSNIGDLLKLLPEGYSAGLQVAYILAFGGLFNMVTGLNTTIIFSSGNYKTGVLFLMITLLVTVIGNYFLIPQIGLEGAAIATMAGGVVYNLLKFFYIWRSYGIQPYDGYTVVSLAIISSVTLLAWLFRPELNPVVSIVLRGGISTVIFALLVFRTGGVDEYKHLIPIFGKNKAA